MTQTTPNHHAGHHHFAGPRGVLNALSVSVGRGPAARLAAAHVGLTGTDSVVDVGCGTGTAARLAARAGATVIGVDPAPVMLRLARAVPGGSRISWREGCAEDLPVDDGSATVLWSLAAVHHWDDIDRGLAEARRVLVPGGRFLAMERQVDPAATGLASHGWTPGQAQALAVALGRAGFTHAVVTAAVAGRQPVLCVSGVAAEGTDAVR